MSDHNFVTPTTVEGFQAVFKENLANPLCQQPGCNKRLRDHRDSNVSGRASNGDRASRSRQAELAATQHGLDAKALDAAANAVWSNLNPDSTPYAKALSAAIVALLAAKAES